ncbi:FMN reductase (NADPH) [Shouchella clausii]|uniref:NADPH-dependent FMN reductase n=1 Tax=Shouchella clausii TaxID=79880 RepID=UPI000BA58B04|nr:NADPH-dependent FMN reductase [Shouchella clausii]PAF08942.1 FMN reductase (NADPH) [Shouchella clausii]
MTTVLFLSGSPSFSSKTDKLLRQIEEAFQNKGANTFFYSVTDVPPADLVFAHFNSQAVASIIKKVEVADVIVIGSPIYKASVTGVLKSLIDLFPERSFAGKTILPIATGGTLAHYLALDYSFTPVLQTLGATTILKSIFILDTHLKRTEIGVEIVSKEGKERIDKAIEHLLKKVWASSYES